MIKVELFYKVSLHGTDWMMTEEEYKEFRETALNLPLATIYPTVKTEITITDGSGDEVGKIYADPVEIEQTEESLEFKWKDIPESKEAEDQAEGCPDYIEPPAPEVVCENGVCELTLSEEKPKEAVKKVQIPEEKDFSPYVKMHRDKMVPRIIQEKMAEELGVTRNTANNYYYSKVKKLAEAEIEQEKKALEKKLTGEVNVIPPAVYEKPKDGKCFTDEDRERLQKLTGIK